MDIKAVLDGHCLYVSGELDHASAALLHLETASLEGLVDAVDLSGVTFVDSAGVEALVTLHRRYPKLTLRSPSRPVRRLVDLVGAHHLLFDNATASAITRRERSHDTAPEIATVPL